MSAEVINVSDRGFAKIKDEKGNPVTVNVFVFKVVVNESAPQEVLAFCNPVYKQSVIKNLRRLMWLKAPKPAETVNGEAMPAIDEQTVQQENTAAVPAEVEACRKEI